MTPTRDNQDADLRRLLLEDALSEKWGVPTILLECPPIDREISAVVPRRKAKRINHRMKGRPF